MFSWIERERGQPWLAGAGVAAPIVLTVFIIVAGLAVLAGALRAIGADSFLVSGRGVRYGVAQRLLDDPTSV